MRLLDRLRDRFDRRGADDAMLSEALERAAARVEPRVRQSRYWPRRFRQPIAGALAQARRIAQSLPGPIELDAQHYTSDRLVHALFASAEDIARVLAGSITLRDFTASGTSNEIYAVLSLRREEKQRYGMEEHNGTVRREVLQRVVWFSDHRFIGPAATLEAARDNAAWALFDRFLARLSIGFERLRNDRSRLAREKNLVLARLRNADRSTRAELQRTLTAILRQLEEATESLQTDHLHEVFEAVLSHPADCLYLEESTLTLDAMGVVHPKPQDADVATLRFTELIERDHEPRTLVFVHCRGFVPIRDTERFDEVGRWL